MKIQQKRKEMSRESWIKNVLRIYPDKTREQAEKLHDKIFPKTQTPQSGQGIEGS